MLRNTLASAVATLVPEGAPTQEWLERSALAKADGFIINVTPAMAATWLKQNTLGDQHNRRFRRQHARSIAVEMARGEWRLTHQGIAFGVSGRLLDGQHRLDAIVQSGTTQPLLVFINAPEEGFANFDRGARRDMSDVLLKDQRYVATANAIINLCIASGADVKRKPMPSEVERVMAMYFKDIEAQLAATSTVKASRTVAPIRAAWVIHHHDAAAPDKKHLCEQWRAFVEMDPKRMDESTASGVRRVENIGRPSGGAGIFREAAAVSWLMFDPARRGLERIIIKNINTAIDEMRDTVREHLPDLKPGSGELPGDAKMRMKVRVDTGEGRAKRKVSLDTYNPFSDPIKGPILRERARVAREARKEVA